jgi:cytochrome c oxidase subunit II
MSLSPRTRPATGMIVAGLFVVVLLLALAVAVAVGIDVAGALRAAVSGIVNSFFPPDAATVQGEDIRGLYDVVFLFAAAIFIGVEALIIWTVIRYRRKPGDDDLPPQTHGNNLAEILWTVIPTVIVAFLFFISWQTLNRVDAVSQQPALQVRAIAGQFQWTFDYLAEDGETVEYTQFLPTGEGGGLTLPVGVPVLMQLDSPDVVHAFYVPRFLFKRDVVPGQTNTFEFTINESEAGQTLRGQCAELCGIGHRAMVFEIHALTQDEFATWYEEARASAQPSGGPPASLPPNATLLDITAEGIKFDKTQLEAPAGQPFGITFNNNDEGIPHDVAISGEGGLLFNGEDVPTVGEIQYVVPPLDAGEYQFLCTIHPQQMTGNLSVK